MQKKMKEMEENHRKKIQEINEKHRQEMEEERKKKREEFSHKKGQNDISSKIPEMSPLKLKKEDLKVEVKLLKLNLQKNKIKYD